MATLEREFSAHWGVDEVFRYFRDGILAGSQSVTDGGGSVYETEGARFIVRVFERFSLTDRDLVFLPEQIAQVGASPTQARCQGEHPAKVGMPPK